MKYLKAFIREVKLALTFLVYGFLSPFIMIGNFFGKLGVYRDQAEAALIFLIVVCIGALAGYLSPSSPPAKPPVNLTVVRQGNIECSAMVYQGMKMSSCYRVRPGE